MSKQSTGDLIAEARRQAAYLATDERDADDLSRIIHTLAERLEAAEQRAAQAEAELKDAYRTDIPSLKDQRDAAIKRAEEAESDRDLFKREQVRLAARCDQAQNERDALAAVHLGALEALHAEGEGL